MRQKALFSDALWRGHLQVLRLCSNSAACGQVPFATTVTETHNIKSYLRQVGESGAIWNSAAAFTTRQRADILTAAFATVVWRRATVASSSCMIYRSQLTDTDRYRRQTIDPPPLSWRQLVERSDLTAGSRYFPPPGRFLPRTGCHYHHHCHRKLY